MHPLDWKDASEASSHPPAGGNIWFATSLALAGLIVGFLIATLSGNSFVVQARDTTALPLQAATADPVPATDMAAGSGCGCGGGIGANGCGMM